jgi:general secretion pathway protein D
MLNGLIKPDAGKITMRGRVGALIALGAGFNPILTGRENIYINGSVLGLSKKEIDGKIDEIIAKLSEQYRLMPGDIIMTGTPAGVGAVESGNVTSAAAAAPGGFTVAAGRVQDSGTNFAAILRALSSDGDTNVVSMPSVITLDNEEAEIQVAQEVPFKTGTYSNTGSTIPGVNPFTTIERKEVGNILKITPQITDEDTILLKIEQESSGIAAAAAQVSNEDLITNKRPITPRVLVDDGGMIVLGGLIEDRLTDSQSRVPLLGSIPLLGELFKTRSVKKTKTNLMVFIRPRVIRDAQQAAFMDVYEGVVRRDREAHR